MSPVPETLTRANTPALLDAVLWCNRATNLTDVRPFCRAVWVMSEVPVVLATDGARLHAAKFALNQGYFPEPGPYSVSPVNQNKAQIRPIDGPGFQLPKNVLDLLKFDEEKALRIPHDQGITTQPGDLYRLICAIGIVTEVNRRGKSTDLGWNPDFLTDALGKAHEHIYRVGPRMLHFRGGPTKTTPEYLAVVMGMRL